MLTNNLQCEYSIALITRYVFWLDHNALIIYCYKNICYKTYINIAQVTVRISLHNFQIIDPHTMSHSG